MNHCQLAFGTSNGPGQQFISCVYPALSEQARAQLHSASSEEQISTQLAVEGGRERVSGNTPLPSLLPVGMAGAHLLPGLGKGGRGCVSVCCVCMCTCVCVCCS